MRKHYRLKHDLMLNELRTLENDFVISGEDAGLHMLLTDKRGRSEQELWELAINAGIKVYRLQDAKLEMKTPAMAEAAENADEKTKATIILGYASLPQEKIIEGLQLLKKVWTIV